MLEGILSLRSHLAIVMFSSKICGSWVLCLNLVPFLWSRRSSSEGGFPGPKTDPLVLPWPVPQQLQQLEHCTRRKMPPSTCGYQGSFGRSPLPPTFPGLHSLFDGWWWVGGGSCSLGGFIKRIANRYDGDGVEELWTPPTSHGRMIPGFFDC